MENGAVKVPDKQLRLKAILKEFTKIKWVSLDSAKEI